MEGALLAAAILAASRVATASDAWGRFSELPWLACFGLAVSFEDADALYPMIGIAAFPIFIGLAFVALGLMNRTKP